MTIRQATIQLAEIMARKAVNTKDIHTTAEGKSILRSRYKLAHKMIKNTVDVYLNNV